MYKYFVSYNWQTMSSGGHIDDCTVIELDYKVDSEETLWDLRKYLGYLQTQKRDGFYVVINTLTLLS